MAQAGSPPVYDAFISYRRSDGARVARWLRRALQTHRVPKGFAELRQRRLVVYMDTAYERSTQDFYEQSIRPALQASRHLIVLATPDAAQRRPDATTDWMWRELQDFSALPQRDRVIVVRAAGDFGGDLPAGLLQRFPNIEVVDLRDAGRFAALAPWREARLNHELVKIVGPLLDIPAQRMPDLRQEQERRQQARLGALAGAATALSLAAVAAAVLALRGEQRAVQALQDAVFATERVILAADRALEPSDDVTDARGRVLDEVCDLRSRMLAEGQGPGGLRELRICEAERARGLLAQGDNEQAQARLDRLAVTLRTAMTQGADSDATVQWLRACDAIADAAPQRLDAAGCGSAAQDHAIQQHRGNADAADALAARWISRAEVQRRKASAAVDRNDVPAALGFWRQAVVEYGQARAIQSDPDKQQRVALDEAATLIAVAAFETSLRRAQPAAQARRAAKQLLDQVQRAAPQDREVAGYARELARKWAELPSLERSP